MKRTSLTLAGFLLTNALWAQTISLDFKVDHFGFRPADTKGAAVTKSPGAFVDLLNTAGQSVARIPRDGGSINALGFDDQVSGDVLWWVDFSFFKTPGTYRLSTPEISGTSYPFDIRRDIYDEVTRVATRAFYYQRCGVAKKPAHAGIYSDNRACHTADQQTKAHEGHLNRGALNLSGGWHDAGDYNKYVWPATSDAIHALLLAYEANPDVFPDGTLGIPESGNGRSDLLDEVKVELDWLLSMQLADGSVLGAVRQAGFRFDSPPSTDRYERFYRDPSTESGAVFVGSTALAARVYKKAGATAYADTLRSAALRGWSALSAGNEDSPIKAWAAAELAGLDGAPASARTYVENFSPDWAAQWYEIDSYEWRAALAYLKLSNPKPGIASGMRARFNAHVDEIFRVMGKYRSGMQDWQTYWGSNRPRALYGFFLLESMRLGLTGAHSHAEAEQHALDYLHFFHGLNTLNMLYLSNMSAFGGEHSSYQQFHGWYGNWDDTDSRNQFIGKPDNVAEAHYPYFKGRDSLGVGDNESSRLGPIPGFVPGGPNTDYGGNGDEAQPPMNAVYSDRAYRDWTDQSVWTARTWEITEPSISYQGAYVALVSAFATGTGDPEGTGESEGGTEPCTQNATTLCLDTTEVSTGRFEVTASYQTQSGSGTMNFVKLSDKTGTGNFGNPENLEVILKVLDGCAINNRLWVFVAGLTDQGIDITIRDTTTGTLRRYGNDLGQGFDSVQDLEAFSTCR